MTREYLSSYADLVDWSRQAGIIGDNTAAYLLKEAECRPDEAMLVLARACMFREAIYRIFAASITGMQPAEADMSLLNAELGRAISGAHIVPIADNFSWEWSGDRHELDYMFAAIARSVAELLTSPLRRQVRECMSDACSWLFVDTTKNHRRRWCTTTGCGNVAKVRRYRQRRSLTP
jgi:predicted RNA-binding Zn ribbon-like protein